MTEQLKQAINALQCAKRGHCDHAMAEKFEAMHANGDVWISTIAASKLCRASLPTQPAAQATPPQQAAGEPVGELVAVLPDEVGFHVRWLPHTGPVLKVGDRIFAHPAPGVPEGWRDAKDDPPPVGVDVLVAVEFDGPGDWRIKVGGRNPQERTGWCVFGASWVPQVWMSLDAHRDALAAAHAKGAGHA